jgi:hypothetical protein
MPTINQLASISQVNGSAQIPVYDQNNGDARKMSVNTLLDYFQTSFAAPTVATNLYTPGAGFNITVPTPVAEQQWMLIQPAGTLATGTVTLPLNTGVPDGTEVLITSTQTITAFTIALNGAAAIFGGLSTLPAGAAVRYRYYLATNSWYNIVNDFYFNPVITGTSLVLSGSASIGTTLSVTGATTLSSTLSVTGVSTLTGGAVVQGMTVGLGLAAVATNTALGFNVLEVNTTGNSNVGVGYQTLLDNLSGEYNFAGGFEALRSNNIGIENTAVGALALLANTGGDYNTAVGLAALGTQTTGNNNVALGYYSGNYETGSNAFYINNQDRTNTAGDKASSLMYGTFNATASSQTLKVNAALTVNGGLIGAVQVLSGAGAVNLTTSTTSFTSTAAGNALTLADGSQGQIKIIVYIAEALVGDTGVLTPTNLGSATTITFNTIGDAVTLQFVGTDWWVVGFRGAVVA